MFGTLALRSFYVGFNSSAGRIGFSALSKQVRKRMEWDVGIGGGALSGSASLFAGAELRRSVEFVQGAELRCVLLHDVERGPTRMPNSEREDEA